MATFAALFIYSLAIYDERYDLSPVLVHSIDHAYSFTNIFSVASIVLNIVCFTYKNTQTKRRDLVVPAKPEI